jgi:localization factor PodJL
VPDRGAATPASASDGADAGTSAAMLPAAIGSAELRAQAIDGKPAAEYEVGLRYFQGHGVTRDAASAAVWFGRAAKQDLAPAAFRLGALYEKGTGVAKDPAKARKWYEKAADAGNVRAMHNLGVLFANGTLGKPDFAAAARWFRRAADHGLKDSQYNLGVLYARGLAVRQNLSEAYLWFSLAADQGDKDAAQKRDDIAAKLGKQQLVTARLAAGTWHAKTPLAAANEVSSPPGGWDGHAAAKADPANAHHH